MLCRVEVLDPRKFHQLLVDSCALSSAVYVSLWATVDCILVLFIQQEDGVNPCQAID